MKWFKRVLLIGVFVACGTISDVIAAPVATSFQLPLDNYPIDDGCLGWGGHNSAFPGKYHSADDACAPAGADVLVVADGVVKFAGPYKPCDNWGYLIIVEHVLPDGSTVNSIYGHIAPLSGVAPDVEVTKGQHIGEIVSMPCWADHIHFGIYKGPYSEITCNYDSSTGVGSCNAHGYIDSWPGSYLNPVDFINTHRMVNPMDVLPYIADREDATFQKLNPFGGHEGTNTVIGRLGVHDGNPHWWFDGEQSVAYDYGVARNAIVQDYTGGPKEGVIVVHPDSFYAVEIYGRSYQVWALYGEDESALGFDIEDECNSNWFGNGLGPRSGLGLPITGVYNAGHKQWMQHFQRGHLQWDGRYETMHIYCTTPTTPGWTSGGWNGSESTDVARAYERNGALEIVGVPFDNGGGSELHMWEGIRIQDFIDENGDDKAILVNSATVGSLVNTASLVRNNFWAYYKENGGPNHFGVPYGDEMDTRKRQGTLWGFDPYCDSNVDGWNSEEERVGCIKEFCCGGDDCGPDEDYSSMQRFQYVTLCYERDFYWFDETVCDPATMNTEDYNAHCMGEVHTGMGGGGGGDEYVPEPTEEDNTEPSDPPSECDLLIGGFMQLEGDLTSWWQDPSIANVDINDCVATDGWLWAYVEGATGMSLSMCNEFFTQLQQAVNVDHVMWWQYTDGSVWNMVHVMDDLSLAYGGCTAPIAPERPEETENEPDEPEPLTECDYPGDGSYMRLEGDLTSWWQDLLTGGYVDLNDCVLDYQWVGVSVGGLNNEAECFEFFDQLESAVDVQHLLWWHYTDGTVWQSIDVMNVPSFMTGYCSGMVAPNMPVDPPESGDDDDATESGDDDDATTPEPPPAPPTVIDCTPNWDTAAGVWGGEWKLCWAYPWNPTFNTWSTTGGLNDQIQYDWSVWFTFGAASQGDANLIAVELQNLVTNGVVVFANVNTGAITPWVHADSVAPTPYGGGYRWMLSPSVGSTYIGPSPVTSVNW